MNRTQISELAFAMEPGQVIAYNWESRSFKLLLADAGYAVVGIVACCIIQPLWK